MADTLALLREASGDHARDATAADTVADLPARYVAAPATTAEVAAVLRVAATQGLRVVARGGGTKLHWGAPPEAVDLLLDTRRLTGVVEHAAGDMVVVARAGTPMRELADQLAGARQRLSLDTTVPDPGATIGGTVATGAAGPLRLRHGTPRDLLIGVTAVRADGVVARAGGKVVKNVAGYDLGKLLAGSYGTLAVITEVALRLHPVPAARTWLTRPVDHPSQVRGLVGELLASQLEPAAIDVDLPAAGTGGTLAVLLEGVPPGVAARAATAKAVLGGDIHESPDPPLWWSHYPGGPGDPPGQTVLALTAPVTELHAALYAISDAAGDLPAAVRGPVGSGIAYVALGDPGDHPDQISRIVDAVRTTLAARGGFAVVQTAPRPVRDLVDTWGPTPGLALMRAVKQRFDPARILSPGRFAGGI